MQTIRRYPSRRAFTLVELVIVLTIIGILAGSGIYMLVGWLDEAKLERVRGDLNTIDLAIKGYERGNYSKPPTQDQGLQALVEKPTGDPQPERWRAYLEDAKALLDPWGNRVEITTYTETLCCRVDVPEPQMSKFLLKVIH